MSLTTISSEQLPTILADNRKVLLKFTADWCGPCKAFNPTLNQAAENHPDIRFVEVDVQKDPNLASQFQVRSIPAVFGFKDGQQEFNFVGALPAAELEKHLIKL